MAREKGEQDRAEKAVTVNYFHATRYPTARIRTISAPSDQRLRAKVPAPSLVPRSKTCVPAEDTGVLTLQKNSRSREPEESILEARNLSSGHRIIARFR